MLRQKGFQGALVQIVVYFGTLFFTELIRVIPNILLPLPDSSPPNRRAKEVMDLDRGRFLPGGESGPRKIPPEARKVLPFPAAAPLTRYLVGAGDSQFVEHREEDLRADDHHEKVRDGKDAEYGPKTVDFGGGAQDGDCRHEAGSEGQRHGHGGHSAAAHQEVLGGLLAAPREGVVDADDGRDEQHRGEHHVVPHPEGADGPRRVHGRANWRPAARSPSNSVPSALALASYFQHRGRGAPRGLEAWSRCESCRPRAPGGGDVRTGSRRARRSQPSPSNWHLQSRRHAKHSPGARPGRPGEPSAAGTRAGGNWSLQPRPENARAQRRL